jgi:Arc/MetJ family transcription regulator
MHFGYILICMRTTLNIDDALLREARRLSGIVEKTALVHAGLEALVARESARRLAALGGSEPRLRDVPRRRPAEPAAARRRGLASRREPRGTR